MILKNSKKVSALLLVSIVTVLGLMVTGYAAPAKATKEGFITLKVRNESSFNVWAKNVEAVNLVSGNVDTRWKQDFGASGLPGISEMSPLTPGGEATSSWNSWAPGINQIEWKGKGGLYAGSSGMSKDYNATKFTIDLSKSTSPNDKVSVIFELSKAKSGQTQTIPFTYKSEKYNLLVTVTAKPVIWEGIQWDETYYDYVVVIKDSK